MPVHNTNRNLQINLSKTTQNWGNWSANSVSGTVYQLLNHLLYVYYPYPIYSNLHREVSIYWVLRRSLYALFVSTQPESGEALIGVKVNNYGQRLLVPQGIDGELSTDALLSKFVWTWINIRQRGNLAFHWTVVARGDACKNGSISVKNIVGEEPRVSRMEMEKVHIWGGHLWPSRPI